MGTLNLSNGVTLSGSNSVLNIAANRVDKPDGISFFAGANTTVTRTSNNTWLTSTNLNDVSQGYTHNNTGGAYDTSTCVFTVPVSGVYLFGYNCRIDSIDSGFCRALISVDDNNNVDFMAHSLAHFNETVNYHTLTLTANYTLTAGQTVRPKTFASNDTLWYTVSESQFWGYYVG